MKAVRSKVRFKRAVKGLTCLSSFVAMAVQKRQVCLVPYSPAKSGEIKGSVLRPVHEDGETASAGAFPQI